MIQIATEISRGPPSRFLPCPDGQTKTSLRASNPALITITKIPHRGRLMHAGFGLASQNTDVFFGLATASYCQKTILRRSNPALITITKIPHRGIFVIGSGGRIRTCDLMVMSHASDRAALPRVIKLILSTRYKLCQFIRKVNIQYTLRNKQAIPDYHISMYTITHV